MILTERGTILVALARDARQEVQAALADLVESRADDVGAVSAFLERTAARFLLRLVRRASVPPDGPRESSVSAIRLLHRRDGLLFRYPSGDIWLRGVDASAARAFIKAASRMQVAASPEA